MAGATTKLSDEERAKLIDQIPRDASTPEIAAGARIDSTELGRNVSNTLNALPGAAPLMTGAAAMRGGAQLLQAASTPAAAASKAASLAGPALGIGAPAAGFAALTAASQPESRPMESNPTTAGPAPALGAKAPQSSATAIPGAAVPVDAATAARPATAPYTGGSITKTITSDPSNPSLVGKTTRYGNPALGARPMSDLGAGSELVTTSDGVTTSVAQLQARQAASAADPVALGASQQIAQQQAAIQNARAAADAAGGGRKVWMSAYNASLGAAGTNNMAGNQVQLAGQQGQERTAANRLAQEAPEALAKGAGAQGTLNAQDAYAKALASGDATKIAAAEAQLRGRLGKFDKDPPPDVFDRVQTGVDAATGAPIYSIYSKRTGEVSAQPAGAKQPKYEAGKVYQDAKGNKAKWDGTKFVAP